MYGTNVRVVLLKKIHFTVYHDNSQEYASYGYEFHCCN